MPLVTEPPPTMDLTIQQLDDIVNGHESVVDLCGLNDIPCHTQVIQIVWLKTPKSWLLYNYADWIFCRKRQTEISFVFITI